MDKCPYCSAETRPGDNFCLNCGNRLVPSTSSPQQAQPVFGDATLPAFEDWVPPGPEASPTPQESEWREDENLLTIANTRLEPPASPVDTSASSSSAVPVAHDILDKVEHPARLTLRTDTGEVLQEYILEKSEISIGRAPTSDILLTKDKLTSRRHAIVSYENGNYSIRDERSANGTFVNGQQLEDNTPRILQDNDHIGIGEHEMTFHAYQSPSSGVDIGSMPTIAVSPAAVTVNPPQSEHATAPAAVSVAGSQEAIYEALIDSYNAVLSGRITHPETIRELARRFFEIENDPEANKNFPYDAGEATRNLLQQAKLYEDQFPVRQFGDDESSTEQHTKVVSLNQTQQERVYKSFHRTSNGIIQTQMDETTRRQQIDYSRGILQQRVIEKGLQGLHLQEAMIEYLLIREHEEALHLPPTSVPVILLPHFQNISYPDLQAVVKRLAVFPPTVAASQEAIYEV